MTNEDNTEKQIKQLEKIHQLTKDIRAFDAMQAMDQAKNDDERDFYYMMFNYLLQRQQKEVIARKDFIR